MGDGSNESLSDGNGVKRESEEEEEDRDKKVNRLHRHEKGKFEDDY